MQMKAELIAPCGMNCRLCYAYIRPKNQCFGCRSSDDSKPASCRNCKIVTCETRIQQGWETCAPCEKPCRRLKDLDKRYRTKYHMSMIENLDTVRDVGMDKLLEQQEKRFQCPACGETVSVHRDDCPKCKQPVW